MKKYNVKFNKHIIYLVITLIVVLFSIFVTFPQVSPIKNLPTWQTIYNKFGIGNVKGNINDYNFKVHYINVGKADSILIECGEDNILIDSGDVSTNNTVVEFLKRENINNLDLVVATHPHKDHIGQMANIIYEFDIEKFIMPDIPEDIEPDDHIYEGMALALSMRDVPVQIPKVGDNFNIGEMNIHIYAPERQYESINNNSVVLQIEYKNKKFLFTGDAEVEEEKDILKNNFDLSSDVLKVGHHGSKNSSSYSFLKAVNPKIAVISVGPDKSNLPKQETIDKIKKIGAQIYRTDVNGTVTICTNGEDLNVFTEK